MPPTDVVIAGLVSKVATELRYEVAPAQIRTEVYSMNGQLAATINAGTEKIKLM